MRSVPNIIRVNKSSEMIRAERDISVQNAWTSCEVRRFGGGDSMERPLRKEMPSDMRRTLSNKANTGSDKSSS